MNNRADLDKNIDALQLKGLVRSFKSGSNILQVLDGVDLTLKQGEMVSLVGPSGSGKSTLLQIAGLLEMPDSGEIFLAGKAVAQFSDGQRTKMRREFLGFVYQFHHLLPEFSALENIVLPQMIKGIPQKQAKEKARYLLASLSLEGRADHRPGQLSGGEQQRVAIARALANDPVVLLADEPTGNLDPHTGETVFNALMKLARDFNLAALIATHNPELARRMDRMATLSEGKIVFL